ncbi:MAG TPA: metallopeptidase TldD-related protein [Terriglobales bacterium]|nr:metallopeptidase TldD-related protein [Terriglobales bacterium]
MNSPKVPPVILCPLLTLCLLLSAGFSPRPAHAASKAVKAASNAAKKDQKSPASAPRPAVDTELLATVEKELHRGQAELAKLDPAPYFIGYNVSDGETISVLGTQGAILTSTRERSRVVDVSMRIGKPELDNTHGRDRISGITTGALPTQDDPDAIARTLWRLSYEEYRKASKAYTNAKTKNAVRAKDEDDSPDFSVEKPSSYMETQSIAPLPDQKAWEDLARRYSAAFRKYQILESLVYLYGDNTRTYLVTTEGTTVVTSDAIFRVLIEGEVLADDGMRLERAETFQYTDPSKLPSQTEVEASVKKIADDLHALRTAPLAEPFSGPALLSGRAAAVFFHEVLGHRIEGQRQKGREEGQTFTKKLNEKILPAFLSVTDDPTMRSLSGKELSGFYRYDDEGMPAARVEVVKDGVLRNFLMSRMPVKNFGTSNGHGRAQAGKMPVGRQGNLIVTSSNTVPDAQLRARFVDEIKKQGKPYGLYFEDIQGGFTLTTRELPQAFQVLPVMVWRVYADGRPDELVRGVDIVGTPLTVLNEIEATGDTTSVFNGICGAESGSVPVSAAAPMILFSDMEVQKRKYGDTRPPILPPPPGANEKIADIPGGAQ